MVSYSYTYISAQEVKIEELKKINDRFRRQGESQKDEMDVLKSQVRTTQLPEHNWLADERDFVDLRWC